MGPEHLLGTWALTRVVHDHRDGERRDVAGTATLVAESATRIRWTEAGRMRWPGHDVAVERTLYIDREVDPGTGPETGWMVRFSDGRPFHPWSVGASVDHACQPDHYRGLIEVTGDPVEVWTVTWEATGPHKDYRMVTVHTDRR